MNIVYSSSDSYAQVMGVSLFSLLKNNTDSPELNIFIKGMVSKPLQQAADGLASVLSLV